MIDYLIPWIAPAAAAVIVILIIACGYVKAPPDQAYIISGLKKESKVLIGRAGIRIPFLERMDKLYLGQMTVDIKTEQSVPTNDFINVNVDAVAKVRISLSSEGIKLASKNFLNKQPADITRDLQDSLQGNMREIIGTLSLKEINTDRDSFSDQVMSKASKDMDKLGIEILSCNIQNVTDENDLMIINKSGIAIRMKVNDLNVIGRATQGVRLINLEKRNDEIASVCKVLSESEEEIAEQKAEQEARQENSEGREFSENQASLGTDVSLPESEENNEQNDNEEITE